MHADCHAASTLHIFADYRNELKAFQRRESQWKKFNVHVSHALDHKRPLPVLTGAKQ